MKDTMRFIYCFNPEASQWQKVKECQSFFHACKEAKRLSEKTGKQHCCNS